ncbi:hypothetical protein B0H17DRAFT_1123941 [Mycena rosella]|uniref:Uncharacterized protein n=1 Tax=Mycena rosella TaxID=1033263 RepID=A0AAD7H3C7_MYCRO|nr:hypothetical protein B0H17DRAFT_1123941 [Mycena rosella]
MGHPADRGGTSHPDGMSQRGIPTSGGNPTELGGTSHAIDEGCPTYRDISPRYMGHPMGLCGTSLRLSLPRRRHIPTGNAEAHLTRALGAYLSKAVGGGTFKGGHKGSLKCRWSAIPNPQQQGPITMICVGRGVEGVALQSL